jgi:hypothetical protein
VSETLPCCGGPIVGDRNQHEEWCPTHIRAALTWIEPSYDGARFRERAENALQALIERDGLVRSVTVPDVLPLARMLYRDASVGCCLHLPLAAGQMDRASLQKSMSAAQTKRHGHCETLAKVLLRLNEPQRERLAREARKQEKVVAR